jgi:hypothetical protein
MEALEKRVAVDVLAERLDPGGCSARVGGARSTWSATCARGRNLARAPDARRGGLVGPLRMDYEALLSARAGRYDSRFVEEAYEDE